MSHPLFWPSHIFFYLSGNTSAICLTDELPPECKADVLFLGCSDPRNILYTVYTDMPTSNEPRKIDVTCCDIYTTILAQNTLLFMLLVDDDAEDRLHIIWNVLYHMMLDETRSHCSSSNVTSLFLLQTVWIRGDKAATGDHDSTTEGTVPKA
ncbi:hypothetical protein F5141DRAFT_1068939 [Pisolithus sp. B1]|nr:hypothetical protein F5141DRAFT_1068939 [Pisolithus sp. B1]